MADEHPIERPPVEPPLPPPIDTRLAALAHPPQPAEYRFRLLDWRLWLVGLGLSLGIGGVALRIASAALAQQSKAESFGEATGWLVCFGVLPVLLLCIAAAVTGASARRTLVTAAAVTAASLGFLTLAVGAATCVGAKMVAARERSRAADSALAAARSELAEKLRSGQVSTDDFKRYTDAANRFADTFEGKDRPLGEAMRDLTAHIALITNPILSATDEFVKLGGLRPETLGDEATLQSRIDVLHNAAPAAHTALAETEQLPAKIRRIAADRGVNAEATEAMVRGATGRGRMEILVRIRQIDVELFPMMEEYLTKLRDSRDSWEVVQDQLQVEDEALLAQVNGLFAKIQKLSAEQTELMTKMQQPGGQR